MDRTDLAGVLARVWSAAGYDPAVDRHDGEVYVIAERPSGTAPPDLLWVHSAASRATVRRSDVERFAETLADLSVQSPYLATNGSIESAARDAAESAGITPLDGDALASLVAESGVDASLGWAGTTTAPSAGRGTRTESDGTRSPREPAAGRTGARDGAGADADDERGGTDPTDEHEATSDDEADGDEEIDDVDGPEATDAADAGATTAADATETDRDEGTRRSGTGSDRDAGSRSRRRAAGRHAGATARGDDASDGRSRRAVLKRAATVGAVGLGGAGVLDWLWFGVVFGDGGGEAGMPDYNATRVKAEARAVPPETLAANADRASFEDLPVTDEGTVVESTADGGLVRTYVATGGQDGGWTGVYCCRHEGEPLPARVTVTFWGVLTGTATFEGQGGEREVPAVDVVELQRPGGGTPDGSGAGG